MENSLTDRFIQIISPIAFILIWEAIARYNLIDVRFWPAPSSIMDTFAKMFSSGEIFRHLRVSLLRIVLGFALGTIPALILGLAMGLFRWLRTILNPFVAFAYPIPKSSILPLIMLIFGLGEMTKIVTVALGVFFLVLINTIAGVRNINSIYLDAAKNFGAGYFDTLIHVALPGALPLIFAGLKLGLGTGLIMIVIAEMVGARDGLGYLVWESWQSFSVTRLYVGLFVIGLLGYLSNIMMEELERILVPWKES
jgi:NitT/TauT family transport system permease protein